MTHPIMHIMCNERISTTFLKIFGSPGAAQTPKPRIPESKQGRGGIRGGDLLYTVNRCAFCH